MIFTGTERLSPVANGLDLPHERDLFHVDPQSIPDPHKSYKDFQKFISENKFVIDRSWWQKQYERCKNGYTIENGIEKGSGDYFEDGWDVIWDGKDAYLPEYRTTFPNKSLSISGRHYWYLNFWPILRKIKGESRKDLFSPRFIDIDAGFFMRIALQIMLGKNNMEYKGRQLGYSEKSAGGIIGYNYHFFPNTQNIIVSMDNADQDNTFNKVVSGIEHIRNTQFFKIAAPYKISEYYIRSKNKGSWIRGITTNRKDQALSRFTPYWILAEEIGKWDSGHIGRILHYVNPSQVTEEDGKMERTGFCTLIGTAGEMKRGAADIESMHYNPDEEDLLKFKNKFSSKRNPKQLVSVFTSGAYFKSTDKDGNSNWTKGVEIVKENIAKKKDPEKRYIARTQNPIYAEDGFEAGEDGFFGEEKIRLLNMKRKYFVQHPEEMIERRGFLTPKDPKDWRKGMEFVDSENGWLVISEEPKKDADGYVYRNLYFPGTDSYDKDEANTSTSKGSMVVRKGFLSLNDTYNVDVAYILSRPTLKEGGAPEFYKRTLWTCIYFGFAQNNIEYSNLRIFEYYDNKNFGDLIMGAPNLSIANKVDIRKSKMSNVRGTDPALKPHFLAYLSDTLTPEFIDNIQLKVVTEKLARFKYYPGTHNKELNCDFTIAEALADLNYRENQFRSAYSHGEKEKEKKKEKRVAYKTINGKLQKVYI